MGIRNPSGNWISEITLPTGTTYTIVDDKAREIIDSMASYSAFLGVVSNSAAWTKIEDGSTTGTVLVGSTTTTVTTGNIVIYKPSNSTSAAQEYIWDGSKWNFFGDISASNLGTLAYKNSVTSGSATVTSSGSVTAKGGVTLTKSEVTFGIQSTTTNPGEGNTANYWIYKPGGTVSVYSNAVTSGSAAFIKGVTGRTAVTSLSTTAPTSATVTGGINYTAVNDHTLKLSYFVHTTANTVSSTTSANALTSVTKPSSYTASFDGVTQYVKPLSVTVATAASFSGTAVTISTTSTTKFINSISVS